MTRAAAAALAQRPRLRVRRFFRPEHMSREVAYSADWWDLYAPAALGSSGGGGSSSSDGGGSSSDGAEGTEEDAVSYDDVYGRCHVVVRGSEEEEALFAAAGRRYMCGVVVQRGGHQLRLCRFVLSGLVPPVRVAACPCTRYPIAPGLICLILSTEPTACFLRATS